MYLSKLIQKGYYHFFLRWRKRIFISNIEAIGSHSDKKALLYYMTDPFWNKSLTKSYIHTNYWEITEIVRILNQAGYTVDILDRSVNDIDFIENKYNVFIGNGSGDSGKLYPDIAKKLKNAVCIFYATSTEPRIGNMLTEHRYEMFKNRTGINAKPMRIRRYVDINRAIEVTNAIMNVSTSKNIYSTKSYLQYRKPIYCVHPSTSPKIVFHKQWLENRERSSFLCISGNGFIHKGVDLLVEAFIREPNMTLHIIGPDTERAFFDAYKDVIKNTPNIHYHGFIKIGGKKFNQLARKCSWVISHSAHESCSTSVITGMKAGLVPVINEETSVDIGDFGISLGNNNDLSIGLITDKIKSISAIEKNEYKDRVLSTLASANQYTQNEFRRTFKKALREIIS